jgi:ATP-dependent helicase/nuclease subunit B
MANPEFSTNTPKPARYSTSLVAHGDGFWPQVARRIIETARQHSNSTIVTDLSEIRVLVPDFSHLKSMRAALAAELGSAFIAPQGSILSAWLQQQIPDASDLQPSSESERLMGLYARLRELGWLKKLFAARRNTDLLPLAKTLLTLSDELTAALLPSALALPEALADRWRMALAKLTPQAAALLSDEAQMVWTIWHGQRDVRDPGVMRHAQMHKAAAVATQPLIWIASAEPNPFEADFLHAYASRQTVQVIRPDWSAAALPTLLLQSWPELIEHDVPPMEEIAQPASLSLFNANGLEDEAQCVAQTVINWLVEGKTQIAIVPQDRMVARRVRALLERAQIVVADETGWKLSTTRAAAVLAAWLELVASNAQTSALLEFLKSPFLFQDPQLEEQQRMRIERALVQAKVLGGWSDVSAAVADLPREKSLLDAIAREAMRFADRKNISQWAAVTRAAFDALGMQDAMTEDVAGKQVLDLLDLLATDCATLSEEFSLAEWRALINLQMEQTIFVAARLDQRVMMVPLHATPLRQFDAAILVGGDADHLPAHSGETLFFADAVRSELGLATRASRHQQQLREFAALMLTTPKVVLSWQSQRDGEPNPVSVWIQRLQLQIGLTHATPIALHQINLPVQSMQVSLPQQPQPSAAGLAPLRLSASGYNSLVACPYQFFATRMLRLSAMDTLSELPQKRDYGDWVHEILLRYHQSLQAASHTSPQRESLLHAISDQVFNLALEKNPAAVGFQSRWKKTIPAYLEWAAKHESEDWEFLYGEQPVEKILRWEGGSVMLHGRIDRMEQNAQGELLVLDYKTSDASKLKKGLDAFEDHQLAFYGLLAESPPSGARYVAIDADKTSSIKAEPFASWCAALEMQIKTDLQAIASDTPLPASGTAKACLWCDMRGLCRKGVW